MEKYIFIGGIPTAGKSTMARWLRLHTKYEIVDFDGMRIKMSEDPVLKQWVDFFSNQDEAVYWKTTTCEAHWENLKKQSEAFWPTFMEAVNDRLQAATPAIFEGVNIFPHLAKRDLPFPGIYLLGESVKKTFERNKLAPRWGETEELQSLEAERFFNCERPGYKAEAERYGYPTFIDTTEAEKVLLKMVGKS